MTSGRVSLTIVLETVAGLLAVFNLLVASQALTLLNFFMPAPQHRAANLLLVLILVFCLHSRHGGEQKRSVPWYDWLIMAVGVVGAGFVVFNYETVINYSSYGYLDTTGIILALMLMVAVLEAVRRFTGWVLPLVIVAFVLMTIFQQYLPGLLNGKGYSLDRLLFSVYASGSGIFGVPLGVSSAILTIYLIFARLLQHSGAGEWFINLALALAGKSTGGPAKAAVVASGLFGMISGSPSANAASIGTFTIPLMKNIGYPAQFAGAVEAVASTGGQFMPPVMGAVAFIMAEWLAIPYSQIALAAFLPAALYYVVLFMSVHFEASRLGLKPVQASEIPAVWDVLKQGWHYLLSLGTLLYFLLVQGYNPGMAAVLAILVLIPSSFLARDESKHLSPRRIWQGLVEAMKAWLTIAVVTAAVGILIGSLELSGLGVKFSSFVLDLSGGNLLATMALIGVASFILGMGLDSIPSYMTLATLAAPALIKLGVPAMVAHLYVIYWGLSSFITPPVCLAVYVAAGIAGSKIWGTGWEAVRLGIAVYLIPFVFVYNQALLLRGDAWEIALAAVTALIGATLLAGAVRGYISRPLTPLSRVLILAGGIILIGPGWWTPVLGAALAAVGLMIGRAQPVPAPVPGIVQAGDEVSEVS